jgi:hypothetical protein
MKIIKMRRYGEGLTFKEESRVMEREKCRWLTPDEFLDFCSGRGYDLYLPCRLRTENGLFVRGCIVNDGEWHRSGIARGSQQYFRFGVLGVKVK